MGKPTGFMEIARQTSTELPPEERRVPAAWIAAYRSARLA